MVLFFQFSRFLFYFAAYILVCHVLLSTSCLCLFSVPFCFQLFVWSSSGVLLKLAFCFSTCLPRFVLRWGPCFLSYVTATQHTLKCIYKEEQQCHVEAVQQEYHKRDRWRPLTWPVLVHAEGVIYYLTSHTLWENSRDKKKKKKEWINSKQQRSRSLDFLFLLRAELQIYPAASTAKTLGKLKEVELPNMAVQSSYAD